MGQTLGEGWNDADEIQRKKYIQSSENNRYSIQFVQQPQTNTTVQASSNSIDTDIIPAGSLVDIVQTMCEILVKYSIHAHITSSTRDHNKGWESVSLKKHYSLAKVHKEDLHCLKKESHQSRTMTGDRSNICRECLRYVSIYVHIC